MKVIQQIETRAMRIYQKAITRAGVPDCTETRFFAGAAVCVAIFYALMGITWAINAASAAVQITALVQ